jgi:MATE family multidrug resistance protein
MLAIGIPIGLQFFAEVNAFGLVTIMAGWMGTATLAGHEIALNLASTTFMVPLGVASAASVMVGHAIGAGDTAASQRDAVAALALGVGFMAVMGVVLLIAPGAFARLYTADAAVVLIAAGLLPIAGLFQVFDGMQAVASGILRGAGDTTAAMVLHVLSFWGIGVPLSWVLAFPLGLEAAGLWWGLSAGLSTAAVLQLARVRTKLRRPVARVTLDLPVIQ